MTAPLLLTEEEWNKARLAASSPTGQAFHDAWDALKADRAACIARMAEYEATNENLRAQLREQADELRAAIALQEQMERELDEARRYHLDEMQRAEALAAELAVAAREVLRFDPAQFGD